MKTMKLKPFMVVSQLEKLGKENEIIHTDSRRYYINNVGEILAVLQAIMDFYQAVFKKLSLFQLMSQAEFHVF
jgi:hypothetical protein